MRKQKELFGETKVKPSFERDALGFLIGFAKRRARLGVPFCAEDVTLAAQAKGISPKDMRAWGAIFTAAKKDGHIRRCHDKLFMRAMGHGTLTAGWIGC